LYQVAMAGLSPADIASPIRSILAEQANVRVVLGNVTSVDLEARQVQLGTEEHELLDYDWLVLAVGAQTS
ncbi:NAD(P)/FAD-dependent oxidoreductase, partial [Salmonella enterica subsp. enterica serovar Istanbul]|nr:NAD(P)/FAD-dependent oxidoreductase [Salmonella enterica subsp. enterica serovar Istanbul]